ncbi:hypothetical protein MUP79_01975 [Candidatus Bathyarchaeota archaeon]|nr:hypothetical protein [Candidatus Bathyarchaeota archaeon]
MAQRKIWKSILAKRLLCPAFQPQKTYSAPRMEMYRVEHEETRLQYRMKVFDEGLYVTYSEMPIENDVFKGRIDDIVEKPGCVRVVEYSSSSSPRGDKMLDTAISAGYLKYECEVDAEAVLVAKDEIIPIPDELIERTWKMIQDFAKISSLDDESLLQYANNASGLCNFCDNKYCKSKGN